MAIPKRYTYIFVVAGTKDKFEMIVEHLPPKAITRPPSAVYNIIVIEIKWNLIVLIFDHCQVEIPIADQLYLWQSLEELGNLTWP